MMVWKGAATARVIIGIAHAILSMELADTAPGNVFTDGTLAELADITQPNIFNNGSSPFGEDEGGVGSGRMFDLDEPPNEVARQQRHHSTKSTKKNARRSKQKKTPHPTEKPTQKPRPNPPPRPPDSSSCFSVATYDAIYRDIARIKNGIRDDDARSHFLGGIVRLAAHDFMDYDRRSGRNPMGPDGCFDPRHPANDGLETIWCRACPLREVYDRKYARVSRADFWIAAANAVVRQTSIRNALDLKGEFFWGRLDRDECRGSGERLPQASGCGEIENVFLRNMGLEWKDAVALMGGHTLGRGNRDFSGHHGTWVDSRDAQTFDKGYYEALLVNTWRPRNMGVRNRQDWTTGRNGDTRVMLNTDMCLVFDIDEHVNRNIPCCTRTNTRYSSGQNQCIDREAMRQRCPMYKRSDSRRSATDAVSAMLGGSISSTNNAPFYIAFAKAWRKATTVGQNNLFPLAESC